MCQSRSRESLDRVELGMENKVEIWWSTGALFLPLTSCIPSGLRRCSLGGKELLEVRNSTLVRLTTFITVARSVLIYLIIWIELRKGLNSTPPDTVILQVVPIAGVQLADRPHGVPESTSS